MKVRVNSLKIFRKQLTPYISLVIIANCKDDICANFPSVNHSNVPCKDKYQNIMEVNG